MVCFPVALGYSPISVSRARVVVVLFALLAGEALAFEETVRREEVDAGIHIPVLTKAPTLVTFVEAEYPPEAVKSGLAASVKLMITIGVDGLVSDAVLAEGAGNGFDEAAIAAVKRFIFTPAEVDFKPAPVQVEYIYHFALQIVDAGVEELSADAGAMATLEGRLFARGSRSLVTGAVVRCDNVPDKETYSDDEGHFSIQVPAGICEVRIAAAEYDVFKTKEPLEPNETKEVKYYILPRPTGFQTVVRDTKEKKEVVRR